MKELTVFILSYNEEDNIHRLLNSVVWADNILVLDSFSDDKTCEIANSFPSVTIRQRQFDCFRDQLNYGLSIIDTKWVLSLDADYVLPDSAQQEIKNAMLQEVAGYRANFDYCIDGEPIKGSVLPPRVVLFQTKGGTYYQDGHAGKVAIDGIIKELSFTIQHDDRKPLTRWMHSQIRYAKEESVNLTEMKREDLMTTDRIRMLIIVAPIVIFFYTYIYRGGLFSGKKGLYYSFQRVVSELLLSLFLIEVKYFNRKS